MGPRGFVVDGITGRRVFRNVIPMAKRRDCLARDQKEGPTLSIQEEYHTQQVVEMYPPPPTRGHRRFSTVFPDSPPNKGDTDSRTARKVRPTFAKGQL
jgi:hypothetical protein